MSSNSRKILVLTTAYKPFTGGSEIALEEIIKRLQDVHFDILTPRYCQSLAKKESGPNFVLHRVGLGHPVFDKWLFPLTGFLKALFLRKDCVAIHAYQASYGAGAACALKFFFPHLCFILTLQEGKELDRQNWLIKFFRKIILKFPDKITVISHYLRDFVVKSRSRVDVSVIPNGVDAENLSKSGLKQAAEALKRKFKIKQDERVVISVSRFVPKNGLDALIKAMAKLVAAGRSNTKLFLVGSGPVKKELEKLVLNLNLSDFVIMPGEINHEKVPEYLAMADVFARPSVSEGLGNAFLEAMAVGVPVVGTPVGGIPDFLNDGKTGLFCKPNNPDDLAAKIEILLSDSSLRSKLIGNARQLVKDRYDWRGIAEKFRNIYGKI